jgi:hypothetical protein
MAQTRKSIIDEAFMDYESIEKAFKANSKEILSHTMGSEIEDMVKESLEGSIGLTEDDDEENVDLELDLDSEDEAGLDAGDDLDLELGDMEMDDLEMDDEDMDDEDMEMDDEDLEVVDLTDEDHETVVNVFKKMAPEDEIEVVQDGGDIEIKDNETGAEYKIELGGDSEMDMDDLEMDLDFEDEDEDMEMDDLEMDDDEEGEEIEYQIELGDDEEDEMEDEMSEASRTNSSVTSNKVGNRKGSNRNDNRTKVRESFTPRAMKLIKENKVLNDKMNSVVSENETLKEDYNKMVDALKEFRQKLNEVAVFNSNLTYTVRLFTEHSTTKDEKVDIIKRFDEAKTLKESKNIYKGLVKEISNTKAPIKESIEEKLNETKSSGSATEITESKVYVDPQIEKMKALWSYEYKN